MRRASHPRVNQKDNYEEYRKVRLLNAMIILKLIGYMELLFAMLYVASIVYATVYAQGEIVIPLLLKAVLYSVLLITAGLGIILTKRRLFLTNLYLYTFLVLDRVFSSYEIMTAMKVDLHGSTELSRLYARHACTTFIIVGFYIFIASLLARRKVRDLFNLQMQAILKHITFAILIFVLIILQIFGV